MIDFREADSTIVVATHGAGVFRGKIKWQSFFNGIEKQNENIETEISIFPNPFHDHFYVNSENTRSKKYIVKIFDMKGVEVLVQNFTKEEYILRKKIGTQNIPQGLYLLVLYEDGEILTSRKIIKIN